MKPIQYLAIATLLFLAQFGCAPAEQAETEEVAAKTKPVLEDVWVLNEGLDKPESAIYDAERGAIYVSNIVGEGDVMDGDGYVAKVSPDGKLIESRWVDGLNAPKGMALKDGMLLSTDKDALVVIDPDEAAVVARYSVQGDVYLNDVTVGEDGSVFVTDSRFSKVYKLEEDGLVVWLEDEQIQMPNGLHVIGDMIYIVAGDSEAENAGAERYMQTISLADKSVAPASGTEPEGALDAVEPDGKGGIFSSGWASGRLMHYTVADGYSLLRQLGAGCADVDFVKETDMLYVPVMMDHELRAYKVTWE